MATTAQEASKYGITFSQGAAATPEGVANAAAQGIVNNVQGPIPVNQTTTQPPLNLASTIPPTIDNATPMVAGAQVASEDIAATVAESTKPLTTEQIAAKAYKDELSGLYSQDTGKGTALATEESNQNVPGLTKELSQINSEINIKNAEYEKAFADAEKQPGMLTSIVVGQQGAIKRAQASDINLLVARAQAVQGNIALAKETAGKAVDLKYEGVEDKIKVKLAQLQLLQPTLNKQEKAQADFLAEQHQQALDKIAEEKAKTKDSLNISLANHVKTPYVNYLGTWFNAKTGEGFPTAEAFYKASGFKSFQEAYNAGAVTDVSGIPAPTKTQVVEVNGRKVLIDEMTGATIKDLGSAPSSKTGTTTKVTESESSNKATQFFDIKKGQDGKISPQDWNAALTAWLNDGHTTAEFIARFEGYINKQDPGWQSNYNGVNAK